MSAAAELPDRPPTPELVFRPPTTPEMVLVRATWLYATPSESKIAEGPDGQRWCGVTVQRLARGKSSPHREEHRPCLEITAAGWHRAHAALRDQVLSSMQLVLVVAALQSRPTEAIAWAAAEKDRDAWTVWWVHVVGEARGQGVGSALLSTVADLAAAEGCAIVPGQMTAKARPWWKRIAEVPR